VTGFQPELDRVRRAYAARDADPAIAARYDPLRSVNLFRLQEFDWIAAAMLRRSGVTSLAGLDILEVGCGSGGMLQRLVGLGAEPARLAGIDLMDDRIAVARRRFPGADFRVGSAHELPYPDASFDLVSQMTLFSSVVEPGLRSAIAAEMQRVLRRDGRILWYDVHLATPGPDFVPIPAAELERLFRGCRIVRRPATLRWWLLERIAPRSRLAAQLLERLPALCSHTIAVIRSG
jgi:ubiquinone/menaquinone biosynthesis C-methylase UbiE